MQGIESLGYQVKDQPFVPDQGIESLGYEIRDQPLVPDGGVQQFKGAADLLAEFGRNGDTYVVHAAEGETVLPMEVLESSPKLKNMIYAQMEELGLQPERYVIGNELNSLNPVTGQPEFFFKKLFKKIKKVGKKVISIAKKIAPIILPLALPFLLPIGVPLFLSAGIGSLAGNLIAGNSFQDSLKSAAITAVTAGVTQGFGTTSGESTAGFKAKFNDFFNSAGSANTSASAAQVGIGDANIARDALSVSSNTPITDSLNLADIGSELDIGLNTLTSTDVASDQFAGPITDGFDIQASPINSRATTSGNQLTKKFFGDNQFELNRAMPTAQGGGLDAEFLNQYAGTPDKLGNPITANTPISQLIDPAAPGQLAGAPPELFNSNFQAPMVQGADPASFASTSGMNAPNMSSAQYAQGLSPDNVGTIMSPSDAPAPSFLDDPIQGLKDLYGNYLSPSRPGLGKDPGVLSKYGPLLAVGGAGILAADALFPAEEQERLQLGDGRTGQDLLDEDIRSGTFQYGFDPRKFYGDNPYYQRGQFTQARQGGQIDGPGTGTSDSIPAMLSDGEFVMTAKAVRGAGGDDRQAGAKRMYAMMRQFENEAAA